MDFELIVVIAVLFISILVWLFLKIKERVQMSLSSTRPSKFKKAVLNFFKTIPLSIGIIFLAAANKFYQESDYLDEDEFVIFSFWILLGIPLTIWGIKLVRALFANSQDVAPHALKDTKQALHPKKTQYKINPEDFLKTMESMFPECPLCKRRVPPEKLKKYMDVMICPDCYEFKKK